MKIFDPKLTGSIEILNTISGNVTIAGGLTVEGSLGGSATTASYVEYSDIANKPTLISSSAQIASDISGSFTGLSSSLEQRVSANEGSISSLNQASSSYALEANISGSFTSVSSSLASRISSNEGSVDSLNQASSSYLLNTTDTLNGNLTVTGTITAQEFHTEFVSASIIYQSGSTKFGDTLDDKHSFTGSLQVSGSTSTILGNLGINTAPSYNLHNTGTFGFATDITGNIGVMGANTSTADTYFTLRNTAGRFDVGTSATGHYFYGVGALPLQFFTNATERMRIDSSGNVGIGTTSINALAKLEVAGHIMSSGNSTILMLNNTGGTPQNWWIGQDISGANDGKFYVYNATSGSNALTIDKSQNIGIGTTSPDYPLHISNTSAYQAAIKSTGVQYLLVGSNDANGAGIVLDGDSNGDGTGGDYSYIIHESSGILKIVQDSPSGTNQISFGTAGVENKVVIDSSGNLGIGTTNPIYGKLNVWDRTVGSSVKTVVDITNGTDMNLNIKLTDIGHPTPYAELASYSTRPLILNYNQGGNVGINTTSPNAKLQVTKGSSGNVASFTSDASSINNYSGITIHSQTVSGDDWYGSEIRSINTAGNPNYLNPRLGFFTQDYNTYLPAGRTEKMSILGNGRVGIGTTDPTFKLDVQDSTTAAIRILDTTSNNSLVLQGGTGAGMKITGYNYNTSTAVPLYISVDGADTIMQRSGGNVGIGTTSPSHKLHIDAQDDNTYALRVQGNTNNVAGVWTGIGIAGEAANTKAAIIFEDIGASYSRGKLHLAINNEQNQNSATPANARITITNDGYVGIDQTSPQTSMQLGRVFGFLQDINSGYIECNRAANGTYIVSQYAARIHLDSALGEIKFSNAASGTAGTNVTLTERLKIKSGGQITTHDYVYGGNLGFEFNSAGYAQIGINTNTVGSEVILVNNLTSGGSASVLQYRTSGTIEGSLEGTSSGLAISNVSDYRKKTDIRDLSNALSTISRLRPRIYKYKEGLGKPFDKDFVGFIAHEIQEVLPDSVTGLKDDVYTQEDIDGGSVGFNVGDPKYQTVSYTSNEMITYLAAAIQELKAEIDSLKAQLGN